MSLQIPPSANYRSPLITLPSRWNNPPIEGTRFVPAEILWSTMGGTGQSVQMNLSGLGAQTFTQIVSLSVDNSQCGADVVFIFPDTQQTYTVPAYSPNDVFPVFTGTTQFYIKAVGQLAPADVTRFAVHNSLPPPISIPVTAAQQVAALNSIPLTGAGSTLILAATIDGTFENLAVSVAVPNAPAVFNIGLLFEDGLGQDLASVNVAGNAASTINATILNLSMVSKRFRNGMTVTQSGGPNSGGTLSINLFYRTP